MTRKATKQTRLDLWLDEADLARLTALTDAWQISRQRVIESALAYAAATNQCPPCPSWRASCMQPASNGHYSRRQRVLLNLDALALAQVERLSAEGEASDSIRAALRAFYASHTPISTTQ